MDASPGIAMARPMIRMTHVKKAYRSGLFETHALAGVSLHVKRGEYVGIMGPSGSGKTTLLNVAGLLDPLDDGEYLLDGVSVRGLSDAQASALRNRKIGFVFQSFQLIGELDVRDNVEVPLRYRSMKASERSRGSGSRRGSGIWRPICRVASSNAWPSRAPSWESRSFSSPTSRRRTSTRATPGRSSISSRAFIAKGRPCS
jgi:ABC-type sugar transport system ATPase subunit